MGASKHYNVVVNGTTIYTGPIRTAEIVYHALESYIKLSSDKGKVVDNLVLSFKL